MKPACSFVVAGHPGQCTGGYRYDAEIVSGLRALGWRVEVSGLPGRFPVVDGTARRALDACLRAHAPGTPVVIDGLALGGLPEVATTHARRLTITALVHHPLADESGLAPATRAALFASEQAALACARSVVTTSRFTARRLAGFGVAAERIHVVEPGVAAAALAPADRRAPHMLCVATLVPRKGHTVLVEALGRLRDHAWTCELVGSLSRDPAQARAVADAIEAAGLRDRIGLVGELSPSALQERYLNADVFVLPSLYEGYGMVVTEALAHGLPVITTTGGALIDTLPASAGIAVAPGDAGQLGSALRRFLEDDALRQTLRAGARAARGRLDDWASASGRFAHALAQTRS